MVALKVLVDGRSAFSGLRWPLPDGDRPGDWVSASGPLESYFNGVHACTVDQLPQWLGDQLWRIELDGEVLLAEAAVVAARGRLLAPVEAWDGSARIAFSQACARRAHDFGDRAPSAEELLEVIDRFAVRGLAGEVGYWTAVLAGESVTGRRSGVDYDVAFERERAVQADWLETNLGLTA